VPTIALTVTVVATLPPCEYSAGRVEMTSSEEEVVHEAVMAMEPPSVAVGLKSTPPKFMPVRVRLPPSVDGMFAGLVAVGTGASYVKDHRLPAAPAGSVRLPYVPTREETVTVTATALDDPTGAVQRTDVWPIHCVDAQTVDPTEAVGEDRWAPKLDPRNVSE